ncbi:MAG: hypothetical protein JG776_2362 [Caloramator sp.]|uniref:hypothetical protein n=1 Tax=Caloramator sp. TaxID=1871330 RepID=UPI001D988975|nr:hypothetical protein [Caloramator sp.]MBZ4664638.1 hypothetical protein [Caloramator sp.]
MMLMKSFDQLGIVRGVFPKGINIDIKDKFSTPGLQPIGTENGLFYWEFSENDVEEFVHIYEKIKQMDTRSYNNMLFRLRDKCSLMQSRKISPVGCAIYATKTINKYLNFKNFIDELVDILYTFNCSEYINEELEHILKKWTWTPQLRIAIKLCGKLGKLDLLKIAYNRFYYDENLRVDLFKALMDTGNEDALPYILSFIKILEKENEKDRQIANYFKSKVYLFLPDGKRIIEDAYNSKNIRSFGRKVLSELITQGVITDTGNNVQVKNRPYYIKLARIAAVGAKIDEIKKKEALDELYLALNNENLRGHSLFALRFTNRKEAGDYIINTLKNHQCSKKDIKDAIMTLGFLAYSEGKEFIIEKYLQKVDYKVYVWAYFALIKDNSYTEKLASELFEEKTTIAEEVSEVIRQIYKSVPELRVMIIEKFKENILSTDSSKILKALKNIQLVIPAVENEFKPILEIIFEKMGYKDKEVVWRAPNVYDAVLSLINKFIGENNIPGYIEKFLFYVMNNESFSSSIRTKAMSILNNVNPGGIEANA